MKTYESITFEVEKDLEKPNKYLPTNDANEIFKNIITVKKIL